MSIVHPVKLAMPDVAAVGFAAQVRLAPAGVVNVKVTELVLVVVLLPAASWMVTTGWVARAVPLVAVGLGAVVKASLAAVRTMAPSPWTRAAVELVETALGVWTKRPNRGGGACGEVDGGIEFAVGRLAGSAADGCESLLPGEHRCQV